MNRKWQQRMPKLEKRLLQAIDKGYLAFRMGGKELVLDPNDTWLTRTDPYKPDEYLEITLIEKPQAE